METSRGPAHLLTRIRGLLQTGPIYVEIRIRTPMERLWAHTQTPDVHARWDMRFTSIDYLARSNPDDPQHFRYATEVGPITIAGEGVTVGNQEQPDSRTSALRFGTDDRKSLIDQGSGYWKYIQTGDGIRFLTSYSYKPRWGPVGLWIDCLLFRRLLGWATAWSFDRLRLWLEDGLDPSVALRQSAIHAVARFGLASIWLYHGIVPKLIYPEYGEADLIRGGPLPDAAAVPLTRAAGLVEIGAAIGTIALWDRREIFPMTAAALIALGAFGLGSNPGMIRAPFNPVSVTIAAVGLCVVGYLSSKGIPTSRRCLRQPPGSGL